MSIIYDALKKLDKDLPESLSEERGFLGRNKPVFKKISFFFLALLLFTFSFFISYNLFDLKKIRLNRGLKISGSDKSKDLAANLSLENQTAYKQKSATKKQEQEKSGQYRLEGIIFSAEQPFAVVNGKRVREKDRLGEFTVTKISRASIELSDPESEEKVVLSIGF